MLKQPLAQFPHLKVLGDTHLGRRFIEGVPLHRRGDREASVRDHFFTALTQGVVESDIVVQTGDIFDGFVVPHETLLFTMQALESAQSITKATYILYRGNHDAARDADKASSFDVLEAFFRHHPKIHVEKNPKLFKLTDNQWFGVMPWDPFRSAADQAKQLAQELGGGDTPDILETVFTHCDLDLYGDKDFNVMPYEFLTCFTKSVINGHVHTPEVRVFKGMEVHMVGSMEPYSHGEDPEELFYVTLTLQEYAKTNPSDLENKNVRILLGENENLPEEIPNCLSFTSKRVKAKEEIEEDDSEVHIEDFSMEKIIADTLKVSGVSSRISDKILERFQETKNVTA